MNEKELIEEMASDMNYACVKHDLWPDDAKEIAKALVILGYTKNKIPEGSVVLSKEELFEHSTQLPREKQIENICNIILKNLDYGYDETARAIYDADYRKIPKLAVILPFDHYDNLLKTDGQVRKETAKEILSLAIKHDNGYETDMTRFISDLKKQYGVGK